MAAYEVKYAGLRNQSETFSLLARELEKVHDQLDGLAQSIVSSTEGMKALKKDIRQTGETILAHSHKSRKMGTALETSATLYEESESRCYSLIAENDLVVGDLRFNDYEKGVVKTDDGVKVFFNGSLISYERAGELGILDYELEAQFGKLEAEAMLEAAFFTYDEDGNRVFNPYVEAMASATAVLVSASASGLIGNEFANLYGNAHLEIAKAQAEVGLSGRIFDKAGNLDPSLDINGKLGAHLIEARGELGGNLLGGGFKATGSVGIGLGAHLDVKVSNDKLVFDIGAAVGLSVSVGFELDIGFLQNFFPKDLFKWTKAIVSPSEIFKKAGEILF